MTGNESFEFKVALVVGSAAVAHRQTVVAGAIEPVGEFDDVLVVFLLRFGVRLLLARERLEVEGLLSICGQLRTMATLFLMSMSLMVQPERRMAEACPPRMPEAPPESKPPLAGTARTSVMPTARVTGMCWLEGRTASAATTSGLKAPVSVVSTVAMTAEISLRPICVTESKRPGYTCRPLPSMTCAPAGVSTLAPTAATLPSRRMMVPSSIGAPVSVKIFAWVMA